MTRSNNLTTRTHSARRERQAKRVLTDLSLKALKPAAEGRRLIWDGALRNFAAKITDNGAISFLVVSRNTKTRKQTWKVVGKYPDMSLGEAREAAGIALKELSEGRHPDDAKIERERKEAEARDNTFGKAAEEFVADLKLRKRRTWHITELGLRREFANWWDMPVTAITRSMMVKRLDEIKRTRGLFAARHALGAARRIFNWLLDGERFGLTVSAMDRVRDRTMGIDGNDLRRTRVLDSGELADLWAVLDEWSYPAGPAIKLLALTGQRLGDVSRAHWSEIDLEAGLLTISAERYKSKVGHVVPLSAAAVDILKAVPRIAKSPFVFTTSGRRPMSDVYRQMREIEKAIAKRRKKAGREPMKPFVLHDIRRSVRTRLTADCGVDAHVAELVIGHAKVGLDRIYDQGSYLPQKRDALNRWAEVLERIVGTTPPAAPAEVVQLRERRTARR